MADINFFRQSEIITEFAYQGNSIDKTSVATAVTPTEALRYTQSFDITINENVMRDKFIGGGEGRNVSVDTKGPHEASAVWSFWLSKDLAQTDAQEGYLLKMPIDGTDTDASNVYTIPDTANEYGGDYLKVMTIEAGWVKSGNNIPIRLTGAIVNNMTFHAEEGQNCLWTYNIMAAQAEQLSSSGFSGGSVAESTEKPFHWGDVLVQYDDAGSATALDGVEMMEFGVENNVTAVRDLANATTTRNATLFDLDKRDVSGTFRVKMTTAQDNGQDLLEDLFGDATGDATPSETITLKDITITLYVDGTYYVKYTLHDVVINPANVVLHGTGVSRATVPFTARACVLVMKMEATNTEPTNWAE